MLSSYVLAISKALTVGVHLSTPWSQPISSDTPNVVRSSNCPNHRNTICPNLPQLPCDICIIDTPNIHQRHSLIDQPLPQTHRLQSLWTKSHVLTFCTKHCPRTIIRWSNPTRNQQLGIGMRRYSKCHAPLLHTPHPTLLNISHQVFLPQVQHEAPDPHGVSLVAASPDPHPGAAYMA